ncbi:unnamed protein product [Phytomonas sp. EM1]|nr:unnamed protein product [Phytomonas sp. EM1]|eukprot:CCW65515.1 unnamed protein product [Phytomonas sp. isolate EM1]
MEEIHSETGWTVPSALKQPWRHREVLLRKGIPQSHFTPLVVNAASTPRDEEIVIAVRSMCVKKDLENGVNEFHTFNWSRATTVAPPLDAANVSGSELLGEGEKSTVMPLTWNVEPCIIETMCYDHQPCEFLWNAAINPATLQSHLKLFVSDSKEKVRRTRTEPTDMVKSTFVTQNCDEITDSTAQGMHSTNSLSSEKRNLIRYKVSQLPIPVMTFQFNFSQCIVEEDSAVPCFHRIGEVPLCIIYEAHPPLLSPSIKDHSQGKQRNFDEPSYSNHTQDKSNQKPTSVGTLGRYLLIE